MIKISGKIPISIYPFFWILAFLIGWINTQNIPGTFIWTTIILLSVLVHEFGHALTALSFGQSAQIELVGFGGVTQRKGGSKLKLWKEFIIVLNGPLAGFCLSGFAWWVLKVLRISHPESLLTYAAEITFYVNFFWTILNLIPVQPLDGGKLLSILLQSVFGLKGIKIGLFISLLIAAVLGILFFIMREYFVGSLFMLFTFESFKSWKESLVMTEEDQNTALQDLLKAALTKISNGDKEGALKDFQQIRLIGKNGVIYQSAIENIAQLLVEKDQFKEAYEILSPLGKKLSTEGLNLLHELAYKENHWEEVIDIGGRVYQNFPNSHIALINALSYAALGRTKPSVGWLECAIQDGIPNIEQVLERREFDLIRKESLFQKLYQND